MQIAVDNKRTSRFIDKWTYVALGATGFVLLAFIASGFFKKTLISKNISVGLGQSSPPEKITLEPQLLGALRVDVKASIPTNTSLTYQIQLLDQQGKIVASAIKNAWSESGTWYEDGESGTWAESDLLAGLDVRAKKAEELNLVVSVLEYERASGSRLVPRIQLNNQKVGSAPPKSNFNILVENGVVDTRPLFPALFGTIPLAIMAMFAVPRIGKKVISKKINDSDPSDRATLGGADKLVRVKVDIASDETSPSLLQVKLVINNSYGEQVYMTSKTINLNIKRENGKVEKGNGSLTLFFIFEKRDSYGFNVEVLPDKSIDRTTLTVREGARTLSSQEVIYIKSDSANTSDNIPAA